MDDYTIDYGISKGFDGSAYSKTLNGLYYVLSTVSGPTNVIKNLTSTGLNIKLKIVLPINDHINDLGIENYYTYLINKIVSDFINYNNFNKALPITVITNSVDFIMILNTISISLLNSGIPLKTTFYANIENNDTFCIQDVKGNTLMSFNQILNLMPSTTINHKEVFLKVIQEMLEFSI